MSLLLGGTWVLPSAVCMTTMKEDAAAGPPADVPRGQTPRPAIDGVPDALAVPREAPRRGETVVLGDN